MSRAVEVTSSSRIHVDLIDMSASLNRINGSVGFSVERPRCRLRLVRDAGATTADDSDDGMLIARELEYAKHMLGVDAPVRAELTEAIPGHAGFGSGTQYQLAILAGVNALFERGLSVAEIVRRSTRGRTSGLGSHAFVQGGFIVDGGRPKPASPPIFQPSRFATATDLPPLTFRAPFPDSWGVIIYVPTGYRGLAGEAERVFMERHTPLAKEEVADVCHTLLMETLPAICLADLELFATSIARLQTTGWKARHWSRADLSGLASVADELRRAGIRGVGLSSTGPALFGFYERSLAPDADLLRARLISQLGGPAAGVLYVTSGSNHGMHVKDL